MSARLTALVLALLASPALAQDAPDTQGVLLRWHFPAGEQAGYRFDQERVLEITKPGDAGSQKRSRKNQFVLVGKGTAEDERQRVEMRMLRLRERVVTSKQPDRELDTGAPGQKGNWPSARPLLQPIVFLLSDRGEAELESFGGHAVAELPDDKRAHMNEVLRDGLIRNLALSMLGTFPEQPLPVGESWKTTTVLNVPGLKKPLHMTLVNTLTSVEDGVALIDQSGEANEDLAALGLQTWSQQGQIHFDLKAGRIVSTEFVSRLVAAQDDATVELDSAHRLQSGLEEDDEAPPQPPGQGR